MLFHTQSISCYINAYRNSTAIRVWVTFTASISSLKVVWRKDQKLDQAIKNDKSWRLCAKVVKEVLNEPGQVISLRYLENQREHDRLQRVLDRNERVYVENEPLIVPKLCKLLMMSKDNVVSADMLVHVKREFGFQNDVLVNLVPKYPEYFLLVRGPGEGNSFLQADKESELTGIKIRPSFNRKLPSGFLIRKEMREWIRDWKERLYISLYDDASNLNQASLEMEKRTVGVFHELLSLSLYKRIPTDTRQVY
ncbi:putative plant organelle RNA recognition domain-containing protein [Helianthus debilis subsp. tardiflorus]